MEDGCIKYKNHLVKLIKVFPINYDLKSDLEKEAILNSYKTFLKTCDFDIQIIVQSKKENLSNQISTIQNALSNEKNPKIIEISENYIEYIKQKNEENKASSKNFYIVIKSEFKNAINSEEIAKNNLNEKYLKVKESIMKVGNQVKLIQSKEEIKRILISFYNQRIIEKSKGSDVI